ncbi:MAG: hypothetical protein WA005_17980 [Candidatus Binataceae bacterium]
MKETQPPSASRAARAETPGVSLNGWKFSPSRRWGLDRRQTAMLAGVLLLVLLAYLRSLGGGFVYDDHKEIVQNRFIGQWSFLWQSFLRDSWWFRQPNSSRPSASYYRPLQNAWFALNYHLFGLNPLLWHAAKIALLLGTVALCFRAAQLLTNDVGVALLSALWFGLLPTTAEVVAWLSAVPEPLTAFFELSIVCYLVRRPLITWRAWAMPLLLFGCALLSWDAAVIFPVLVGAYFFLLAPEDAPRRRILALWRPLPFVLVALAYLAIRFAAMGPVGYYNGPSAENSHSFAQVLATAPEVLACYLKLPAEPWAIGPASTAKWVYSFASAGFYLPAAALLVLAAAAWFAIQSSPRRSLYLFCGSWFLLQLVPALNLPSIIALTQNRYLYVASFGWCLALADLLVRFSRRGRVARGLTTCLVTAVSALYAIVLWNAQGYWKDDIAMYRRAVAQAPNSPRYHEELALQLEGRGNLKAAEREYEELVRLQPDKGLYHYYLYMVEERLGHIGRANEEYVRSLPPSLVPAPPGTDQPRPQSTPGAP